jgi:glycosyltransferase involved in cell wall biosynthesis
MKVAMIGDYPREPGRIGGGVEAVVACLAQHLARYPDLDLHVVTLRQDVARYATMRVEGYTVHYIPASFRFANLTFFAVNRWRLHRVLQQLQPDLIHLHIASLYAEVVFNQGRPAVLTPHGIRSREAKLKQGWIHQNIRYPLQYREELNAIGHAPHLISISPYIESEFRNVIRGRVHDIEVPIDETFFEIADRSQPERLLFVGHVGPRKGAFDLLRTLPEVRKRFPNVQLHFAGKVAEEYDDTYFPRMQQFMADHGLEGQVRFLGQLTQPALRQEYAECVVMVLPSFQETAPSVIEQAMAACKPVISTRVGGIPHLVEHGETGLLIEAGDVSALTEAIVRLLSDAALRRQMGQRARQLAEARFRADVVAQQTLDVYQQMLAERPIRNGRH